MLMSDLKASSVTFVKEKVEKKIGIVVVEEGLGC